MENKILQQLKLSTTSSSSIEEGDEKFLYETIEAPKFVDFTTPNHFCPDDRYWFCSRVGCDRKHEEEMDSEAIYKNFVLRVMAARSPNVRLRKTLIRHPPSEGKKCPLSAPPKPAKARLLRPGLVTSISKMLINEEKDITKAPPVKPSSTPKARVKIVAAKYMTSPRKKKGETPKQNAFRSVRNTKRTSINIANNKVVAKALAFNSPKKALKVKAPHEMAMPKRKLCEGIRKLDISSHKKTNTRKQSKECKGIRRVLPADGSRKKPSVCKAKSQQDANVCRRVKRKTKQTDEKKGKTTLHDASARDDSSDMEIDEKSRAGSLDLRNTSSNTNQEEANSSLERPTTGESSNAVSENTMGSEIVSSEGRVSVPENEGSEALEAPNTDEESKVNKGTSAHGELENQNGRVLGQTGDDDKENAADSENFRNVNGDNLSKVEAPVKRKIKSTLTSGTGDKTSNENCSTGNKTSGVKYRKLKLTNPKPFKLRTDERGILKDTLERKTNAHENATVANENLQCTSYGTAEKREKKDMDRSFRMNLLKPIKSKYKINPKGVETKLDTDPSSEKRANRIKTSTSPLQKQLARPQRETVSQVKPGRLQGVIEETKAISKPKEPRKKSNVVANPTKKTLVAHKLAAQGRRTVTVPRELNFHRLHEPMTCTKHIS